MKVVLTEGLFDLSATQANPDVLPRLFRFGSTRQHSVVLGFRRSQSTSFRLWLANQSAAVREVAEIALRHGRQSEAREVINNVVSVEPLVQPEWEESRVRLPPEVAVEVLSEPLQILVENSKSDGAFLQSVALGWHRDALRELLGKGWVRFLENDEGLSGIKRRIEETPGPLGRTRLRLWVVFDSDALAPERPSKQSLRIDEFCLGAGIKRHRLKRRSIENYIPPHELHDYWQRRGPLSRRQAAGAFLRLAPPQRHHFNMKSGFAGDAHRPNEVDTATQAEVEALFSAPPVSEQDRAALERGFGEGIAELFQPDEAHFRNPISEDRLRRDGQADEMEPLLRDILRWV